MTGEAIFLQNGDSIVPLAETAYKEEKLLQKLLADYPDLIAGVTTNGEPGRLLLVQREMPVPDVLGGNSMSLDHLFVDSDGVPVLIEVKRSADRRAKREVVAQMIDYAANGPAYWPAGELRTLVEQRRGSQYLDEWLGTDVDPDQFWRTVDENLRLGRLRLVFLADRLPPELVRMIEFLNGQMHDTEVLGVELPQFASHNVTQVVYSPRVIGRTQEAANAKRGTRSSTKWTRESLLATAAERCNAEQVAFIRDLLDHVVAHGGHYSWGTSPTSPGVSGWYSVSGADTPVWNISVKPSESTLYFILGEYALRHPDQVHLYGDRVAAIGGLEPRVTRSRDDGWKGWIPLPVGLAVNSRPQVMQAIHTAIDGDPHAQIDVDPSD